MKKPIAARIAGLVILYCAVFAAVVILQFTKKGNFTRRVGNMTISGQYATEEEGEPAETRENSEAAENLASLAGGAGIHFGGLEFSLRNRDANDGFVLTDTDGQPVQALAETMETSGTMARFVLAGGTRLVFETVGERNPELRISVEFAEGVQSVNIPVRLQRASLRRESDGGGISISYNGVSYMFSRPVGIAESGVLNLPRETPAIAYRVMPERKAFNPADYIVATTSGSQFNDVLTRIGDQDFSYWNRNIAGITGEDEITALCGESVKRGNYRAAVNTALQTFSGSARRTHTSSVFIGGMGMAFNSFLQAEQTRLDRVSEMIDEKSPDFLKESHVFEFLLVRGYVNIAENALEIIRSLDPSDLSAEICPGIFEGYMDIKEMRSYGDNPFERLIEQACLVFSGGIQRDAEKDQVLVFRGNTADIEYNLRLGKALWTWADTTGDGDWAGLGRSLVLSVLLMRDNLGAVPASAQFSEAGGFTENGETRLSAARVYHILRQGEYFPRAAGIGSGVSGLWAWTASSSVSATQENNVLDISVSFPVGETHYLMIRGIRPFTKIQIYNLDYPTDPQFERYDSSGWVYSAKEQILTLKLKHRAAVEHIKIFY